MKNKFICALLTTVMVLSFAACGSDGNGATASTESTVVSESQVTESNAEANTETASTESTSTAEGAYEDNFAVPTEDATAFAKKIQDAVAARRFWVFGAAVHRQPLRLRENDVVLKRGIDVGLDVLGGSP